MRYLRVRNHICTVRVMIKTHIDLQLLGWRHVAPYASKDPTRAIPTTEKSTTLDGPRPRAVSQHSHVRALDQ